jgi:hypothetical protein
MSDKLIPAKRRGVVSAPERLPLDTLEHARRSLARVIKAYYSNKIDESVYRGVVYGMTALLAYFKAGIELEELKQVEDRLSELEKREGNDE